MKADVPASLCTSVLYTAHTLLTSDRYASWQGRVLKVNQDVSGACARVQQRLGAPGWRPPFVWRDAAEQLLSQVSKRPPPPESFCERTRVSSDVSTAFKDVDGRQGR